MLPNSTNSRYQCNLKIEIDDDIAFCSDSLSCDCSNNSFTDPYHGHVVTGDLRLVENTKLRNLFSKGPNYREAKTLNFSRCLKSIEDALDISTEKFTKKHKLENKAVDAWKNAILHLVNEKIQTLKRSVVPHQIKPLLKDSTVVDCLKSLHSRYVVTPIDKASKNVAFICKKYYINSLMDELGIPGNYSPTYFLSNANKKTIIDTNRQLCNRFTGKDLQENEECLPIIHWIPKMHYTPSRRRFIIASSVCSTKPLIKSI